MPPSNKNYLGKEWVDCKVISSKLHLMENSLLSLENLGKMSLQKTNYCWEILIASRFFVSRAGSLSHGAELSRRHLLVLELPSATAQKNDCFSI